MLNKLFIASAIVLLLSGCQTPADIQQLQNDNQQLQQQLAQANQQIATLNETQAKLEAEAAELNRVIDVLGTEKTSRVVESTSLRGQVRGFVKGQIDQLRRFVLDSNLVDYIGAEQVERGESNEEPLLIVDMAHPVPENGSLTGVGAYFNKAGTFSVKVLREVDNKLVVIWESLPLSVSKVGAQRFNFSVAVGVQKGDKLAYYITDPGMVSFDKGTGESLYLREDVRFGQSFSPSSLRGEDERLAYSIGVYGLLNTE